MGGIIAPSSPGRFLRPREVRYALYSFASIPWNSINNGPYYQNYDFPIDGAHSNGNLFFYQGQARTWITRTPLTFDKWIPSVLFLTHYFPDDPREWQEVKRGFAGPRTEDITESDPVVSGLVSGSPEIHEKISSSSGRGAVAIFATVPGTYEYLTKHKVVAEHSAREGLTVERQPAGWARITARFDKAGRARHFLRHALVLSVPHRLRRPAGNETGRFSLPVANA